MSSHACVVGSTTDEPDASKQELRGRGLTVPEPDATLPAAPLGSCGRWGWWVPAAMQGILRGDLDPDPHKEPRGLSKLVMVLRNG